MTNAATLATTIAPNSKQRFKTRVLPFIVFGLFLVLLPLLSPSRSTYSLVNAIGINIVFALSYNMLLGRGGMLSFGHAVYFGLGGYASVWVMRFIGDEAGLWAHVPVFMLPVIGFMAGSLASAVIGFASCRRAGVAFAMISLGVAELIAAMGFMFSSIFGGEAGISADRMTGPQMFGLTLGPLSDVYWFTAFWTLVGAVLIFAIGRTPLGRLSEATRDNPERVEFIGFDPLKIRYLVFILAGGFAGLAGGMSAVNYEIFTPDALAVAPSGFVLLMAYVGGIRYFAGPILGAILLTWMQSNLSDYSPAWLLYLGLMFIVLVMFAQDGLAGILARLWTGVRHEGLRYLARFLCFTTAWVLLLSSVIILVEAAHRYSEGYGDIFTPFDIPMSFSSFLTWAAILSLAGMGLALMYVLKHSDAGADV